MKPFHSFVVFAEMRTGSNFLEKNLNDMDGISCHGEAFNPYFICWEGQTEAFGVTLKSREKRPEKLLAGLREYTDGLPGFRFFSDHHPAAFDTIMADPACAKVVLTRNPLDSYVSYKIARKTNQWVLTDDTGRVEGQAEFDATEFDFFQRRSQEFYDRIQSGLQRSGQTAFYINYEQLNDLGVLNGLATFLGAKSKLKKVSSALKKQNAAPMSKKVSNYETMVEALEKLDPFRLSQPVNFEPVRGPLVPKYVAAKDIPLLFMPVGGSPEFQIETWLAKLSGVGRNGLTRHFDQRTIRQWKRKNPGHRSFTVVSHPLTRAHAVFCERIVGFGPTCFPMIRDMLNSHYGLGVPDATQGHENYSQQDHRKAFLAFLRFLKANLAGQTTIRIDGTWCSQHAAVAGLSSFVFPDRIMRAEDAAEELPDLAARLGVSDVPAYRKPGADHPYRLSQIYDADIEKAARDVYQRDYLLFGYGPWSKQP